MLKIAKLVSGEFVVGKFDNTSLTNVMLIRFNVNKATGQLIKELHPYMAPLTMALGRIISIEKVIVMEDAPPDIQSKYLETLQNMLIAIKRSQDGKDNNGQNAIPNTDQETTTEIKEES